MDLLREKLETATLERHCPPWSRLSMWHQARAESFIMLDENSAFVVNRNTNGHRVAVTYIEPSDTEIKTRDLPKRMIA